MLLVDPKERRAATMDGDRKRVFLERLRANPFPLTAAHYAGAGSSVQGGAAAAARRRRTMQVNRISPNNILPNIRTSLLF